MRRREGGLILPALLILLLFGGIAVMLGGNDLAARVELHYHQATISKLARARAALIGYAQSYHLTHPGQSVGYLPCPDLDSATDEGSAEWRNCGYKGDFAIGRFPYRTLGLPPLRDGYGECLWYAVAGSFKNKPKGDTLNWDTPGQFNISDGSRSLIPALHGDQLAVAVVFAPGRPLAGQNRGSSARRCSGDAVAASALQAYLEGDYAVPGNLPIAITQGRPTGSAKNDVVAWITADDVFSKHFVKTMLDSLASSISAHPDPRPVNPVTFNNIDRGSFPLPIPAPPPPATLSATEKMINSVLTGYAAWADHFRYFRCVDVDDPPCLTVMDDSDSDPDSDPDSVSTCPAAIVFAGQASPGQVREGNSVTSAYFEDPNVDAIDNITGHFVGPPNYSDMMPAKDIVRCLT